jgi:predicted Zn-dependent protease
MSIELPPETAGYTDRSPSPKNRQLVMLLGFVIGLIAVIVTSVGVAANWLVALVPYSVEQQLGRLMLPAYEQLAHPSAAQTTLNQLLDRLEAQLPAEQQNRDYQILYIPDSTVNAAALPGDRIIIFQGLLSEMKSENELMMVLGHELGHFAHRDHLRQLGRGLLMQLVLTSLFGDMSGLQSIAISGTTTLSDARFSQRQEHQADQFGLWLLQETYGQVAGATDFFERLSKDENSVDFLATHPGSKQRVQKIKRAIAKRGYGEGSRLPLPRELQVSTP